MGNLIAVEILILVFIGIAAMFKGVDRETKKLLWKIDAGLTAIFVIADLLLLLADLKGVLI